MSAARTERLLNLLTLLLNSQRPISLAQLREMEEFSAYCRGGPKSGERAFERDKAALLELGVPLRWVPPEQDMDEEGTGGYVVDREKYYLPQMNLSPSELALLSIAGAAALGTEGLPGRAAVIRAMAKLGFDVEHDAAGVPIFAFSPLLPGIDAESHSENLELLHRAVAERLRVLMQYRGKSRSTERVVEPYGLYYRRGAWYLVGFCRLRKAERTFHLGRIEQVKLASSTRQGPAFAIPEDFDLSVHVRRRPWEFPHEQPSEVVIKLAMRLVPVAREIFGPGARLEHQENGCLVHLTVTHQDALVSAVLPYGAATEVLEPPALRQRVGDTYRMLVQRYTKDCVAEAS